MKALGEKILTQLENKSKRTKLVGILNITPDSFSDGGKYLEPDNARKRLIQLIEEGAEVVSQVPLA